jgi:hypothetical protein
LIEGWLFNPDLIKIRKGLKHIKSLEEIEKLGDEQITQAFIRPPIPKSLAKLYNFLQDNQNLMTTIGGMDVQVTGLDRYKLAEVGKGYNINIYKWMYAINMYEKNLIKSFNNKEE